MRNPAFVALIEQIQQLHEDKNHDYAEDTDPLSNLRRAEKVGVEAWRGVLVRLTDKWSRIEQLTTGKTPKNESLRDSLVDNAVYSLLCVLLLDEMSSAPDVEGSATYAREVRTPSFGRAYAAMASTTTPPSARTVATGTTGE